MREGRRTLMAWRSFWWWLTWAVVLWYATITIYVGVRGVLDIRQMLARLGAQQEEESDRAG
jgi:hypothetical protein